MLSLVASLPVCQDGVLAADSSSEEAGSEGGSSGLMDDGKGKEKDAKKAKRAKRRRS